MLRAVVVYVVVPADEEKARLNTHAHAHTPRASWREKGKSNSLPLVTSTGIALQRSKPKTVMTPSGVSTSANLAVVTAAHASQRAAAESGASCLQRLQRSRLSDLNEHALLCFTERHARFARLALLLTFTANLQLDR